MHARDGGFAKRRPLPHRFGRCRETALAPRKARYPGWRGFRRCEGGLGAAGSRYFAVSHPADAVNPRGDTGSKPHNCGLARVNP
jgi:hypothetical protein